MKVYYVTSNNWGAYVVRCLLPLVANGWDGDSVSLIPFKKTPEDKFRAANDADIVVIHRPSDKTRLELVRLLKQKGKKIVVDNDDTFKDHQSVKLNEYFDKERVRRGLENVNMIFDACLIEADLVTTTTEFLAEEYRKLNKNVVVLPNCVDPFYFDEPLRNETDIVRIGITGSITNTGDLDVAAPIIRHYEKDKRVKIVFFGLPSNRKDNPRTEAIYRDEYAFLDSVDVEWHPAVDADKWYDKINELRLDIMLIPREDNYFNRCKSNLKFLEASMFEIPCICSAFADEKSPYQANPLDRENLVLVYDNSKWIEEIEKLIADKEGRRALGKKAHEYVLTNYNIDDKAHLWEEAYRKIL